MGNNKSRTAVFSNEVHQYLAQAFCIDSLALHVQSGYLIPLIEHCFALKNYPIKKERKAEIILSTLFALLFPKSRFLWLYKKIVTKKEKKLFLSHILYRLYFNDIPWQRLINNQQLELLLYQWLASFASEATIARVWKSFSYSQQIYSLAFYWHHMDEGGYRIFQHAPLSSKEAFCMRDLVQDDGVLAQEVLKWAEDHMPLSKAKVRAYITHVQKEMPPPHLLEAEKYRLGLGRIVFAMPTRNKELSYLPWLFSMSRGLKKICLWLDEPLYRHPLIVFDQSKKSLFAKNARFIKRLGKREGISIIHLSKEEVCQIADKLHVRELIETTDDGQFGFGGSRNAIFLLAPIVQQLWRENLSFSTVSEAYLQQLFSSLVLESKAVVQMGDDDIHMPASNFFADAFFASLHADEYFFQPSRIIGRHTVEVAGSLDTEHMRQRPQDVILQNSWQEEPFFSAMTGILSKPKLCLNLPHGQEESSLEAMRKYVDNSRKPLIHLAGVRYPETLIPQSRFSGNRSFFKKRNLYVLQLLQMAELVDPLNHHGRSALPWNLLKKPFHSLGEAMTFMIASKHMQQQFWKNFQKYAEDFVSTVLKEETSEDFQACRQFIQVLKTSQSVEQAKQAVEVAYSTALYALPFTYSLYLLCSNIGNGRFLSLIAKAKGIGRNAGRDL